MELSYILVASLICIPSLVWGQGQCSCPVQNVTGMGELDGLYILNKTEGSPPEPVCVDSCVYKRENSPNADDLYCFKSEESLGNAECQDSSAVKNKLQAEINDLENQEQAAQEEEDKAKLVESKLQDVDDKVNNITAENREFIRNRHNRRQATTDPVATCDGIADLIEKMADDKLSDTEVLSIIEQILSTKITKCKSKTKLEVTKVKIKQKKTRQGEKIILIVAKKDRITKEIEKKKIVLNNLDKLIEELKKSTTAMMPPASGKPTGGQTLGMTDGEMTTVDFPDGEMPVEITDGEMPVEITDGEMPVEVTDDGEMPVEVTDDGEMPVEVTDDGESPVEIGDGGEKPVEVTDDGEKPMEVTDQGEKPVGVSDSPSEEPDAPDDLQSKGRRRYS